MNFKIPKTFMGVPVNERTLEEALGGIKNQQKQEEPEAKNVTPPIQATGRDNPADYILLPARLPTKGNTKGGYPDLLVSVEKRYHGKNWTESHIALAQEGAQMLTIRQFVDFLNLLKSGSAVDGLGRAVGETTLDSIFNEITEVRGPWRGEWLDAQFESRGGLVGIGSKMHIEYGHELVSGILWKKYAEELGNYLTRDKTPGIDINDWLSTINQHGLPQGNVADGQVYYWYPRNGSVAGFVADSDRACLNCVWDSSVSDPQLGVRAVRKKIRRIK